MHRVDDADYVLTGGKRLYKDSPIPGTLISANSLNALQEEIARMIEASGQTLAASSAADTAAGWAQLTEAVQRLSTKQDTVNAVKYNGGTLNAATINAAITDISSATKTLFIRAGNWTIDANIVFPNNIHLVMDFGAIFVKSAAFTVTLPKNITFAPGQHFNGTGTFIVLSSAFVSFAINPQWWGAVGDGVTVDTNAFQSALNMLATMSHGVMEIPYTGSYYLCGALTIGKSGITIRGGGRLATTPTLKYTGTTGDFLTLDGGYSLFENITIDGNTTTGNVVYIQNGFRTKMRNIQIINSSAAAGPFNGTGLRVGTSCANGEFLMEKVLIQKCNDLTRIDTCDGFMIDCILVDASRYHIYSPAGFGGWKVDGLRAYQNSVLGTYNSFTSMIRAEQCGYGKLFNSELEISGCTGSGFYYKFGSQVGNLISDCHFYSNENVTGKTFFEFASISGDAVSYFKICDSTLHVASATPTGNVGFIVSGAYGEATRVILDNVTWDSTINTPLDTTALHFKVMTSEYTAGKIRAFKQYLTNPTVNHFGVEADVTLTDNASGFGYTEVAIRGLATIQADAASALNSRALQGVVTLGGAFALSGTHYAGYHQIVENRSAGTATDECVSYNTAGINGAGSVTVLTLNRALMAFGSSSGALTTLENYSAETPTRAGGTHAITTAYGYRSKAQKTAWVTTAYGFRQEGASDLNVFDGDLQVPRIGVGKLPTQKVEVTGDASYNVDLRLQETSATGVIVRLWKSRGTEASPLIIVDGDVVARFDTLGYQGSAYFGMGQIMCKADGTVTSGQRPPCRWEFYTSVANGAQTLALTIDSAQRAKFAGPVGFSNDTFSNAAKVMSAATTYLGQTGTMSASRAVTLPAASAFPRGSLVIVADESGSVTGVNTIVVGRAGADTIGAGTSVTINSAYGKIILVSDGTSKWTQLV